jgi:hypothetical protein
MTIESRNLKPGTKLVATYKGKQHTAEVVKTADGIRFVVSGDKTEYKSISGAGKSIHGSRSIGGYGFWSLAPAANGHGKTPTAKVTARKKVNAVIASDDELAKEVALAGGAKKVAAKAAGATPSETAKSKKTPAPKARKTATAKS